MVGGHAPRVLYVNLPIDELKKAAITELQEGNPVWFGCHVSQFFWGDHGVMDTEQFDYNLLLGTNLGMNKAERLDYGESLMTHAMVFTGVDFDENEKSTKWGVENS